MRARTVAGWLGVLVLAWGGMGATRAATVHVATTGSDAGGNGSAGSPYLTIAKAASMALAGDTIQIAAGAYLEANGVPVNKPLAFVGAGIGATTVSRNVPLPAPSPPDFGVFELLAGSSGSSVGALSINVPNDNFSAGITALGNGTVSGLTLDQVAVTGLTGATASLTSGLSVNQGGTIANLVVRASSFKATLYGWMQINQAYVANAGFQGVTVTDTEFSGNGEKGIYVEGMSNASFDQVRVLGNGLSIGSDPSSPVAAANSAGFDINLKAGSYQNISITNSTFSGNGLGGRNGAALMIKARDDRSYANAPARASLSGVTITGNSITGNERGIRFGESMNFNVAPGTLAYNAGPTNVLVRFNQINGNVPRYTDPGNAPPDVFGGVIDQTVSPSIVVHRNSLVGNGKAPTDQNGIINPEYLRTGAGAALPAPNTVDGACNWWGGASGPRNTGTSSALLQSTTPTPPASGAAGADMVSSFVTYQPFLSSADLRGPCSADPLPPPPAPAPVPADAPWALALAGLGVLLGVRARLPRRAA